MKEKQIKDLDEIQQFYTQYFTKLECLWYDLESEKISEKRVANKFYRIKKSEESVNRIIAESLRSKPKKLVLIAKENSDNYFKQLYS